MADRSVDISGRACFDKCQMGITDRERIAWRWRFSASFCDLFPGQSRPSLNRVAPCLRNRPKSIKVSRSSRYDLDHSMISSFTTPSRPSRMDLNMLIRKMWHKGSLSILILAHHCCSLSTKFGCKPSGRSVGLNLVQPIAKRSDGSGLYEKDQQAIQSITFRLLPARPRRQPRFTAVARPK